MTLHLILLTKIKAQKADENEDHVTNENDRLQNS